MVNFWLLMEFLSLHQITPLHLAAKGARIKMLKSLVDQGADINIQDNNEVNWHISNLYVGMLKTYRYAIHKINHTKATNLVKHHFLTSTDMKSCNHLLHH